MEKFPNDDKANTCWMKKTAAKSFNWMEAKDFRDNR